MRTGLMISAPITECRGRQLSFGASLELLRSWGTDTLDIFPGFLRDSTPQTVRGALDRAGLSCACYYIGTDLNNPEPQAMAEARDAFRRGLETAVVLGAPIVFTHGTQHSYAGEDMFRRYRDRLAEMLPLVAQAGLTLVVENAGTLMHRAEDMLRLIESLGDSGLRLCLDTGNFHLWEQDEVEAVDQALRWTVHLHVKDYVDRGWTAPGSPTATTVPLGQGDVRHEPIIALLREAGFEGVLALEPGGLANTQPGLCALCSWLGRKQ